MLVSAVIAASLALLLGAWAAFGAARGRAVIVGQLLGAAIVEAALVGQVVVAWLGQAGGHDPAEPWTLWGYMITALIVLPAAAAWALGDRTRWSSVVLLVGAVTVAVMQVRIVQVWGQVVA